MSPWIARERAHCTPGKHQTALF
uniref:Uncharacterized protein n=1 Tax=Anguilla anguilla TaxID=7936 RepID=A0A0E9UI52_ANGAN